MKAIALTAPGVLEEVEVPEPDAPGLAIVALDEVGICGTDLKIFGGKIPVSHPRILGHEVIGRVLHPGRHGTLPAGARVMVDPSISCGHCRECRADRPNLCVSGSLMGRDADGGLVERIAVDELQLHRVPDSISPRAAALLQVLGTCVHSVSGLPPVGPGAAVVIGLGVSGLLHLQLLARTGRPVIGIARSPAKRALALALGAKSAVSPDESERTVAETTGGVGAAIVVEAVGTVATLAQAIRLCAPGGTVLSFGTITAGEAPADFPWYELYRRELRIVSPRAATARDYDAAIEMAARGELVLEPLWSRSLPMAETAAALEELARDGGLKTTIRIGESA